MTTRTLPTTRRAPPGERGRQRAFAGLAAAAAIVAGVAPAPAGFAMPQLVAATAVLVGVAGAYLRSPAAGLVALWGLWLLAPGNRRMLGLTGPYLSADPMALVPFVATAMVASIELSRRAGLPSGARRLLALAALGDLIGVPVGFLQSPPAMVFALLAYGSALLGFVLGYADRARTVGELAISRTLLFLAVPLSAYAVYQYFGGLPSWDDRWLESVDFITTGAPEEGRIRVFSTLNSPGTFAGVVGLAVCVVLTVRAVTPWRLLALSGVLVSLALTYVRSAWVALIAAVLVYLALTRGRGARRVAIGALGCALLFAALTGISSTTGDAVSDRFSTLGELEEDKSANDRVDLRLSLVPQLATAPLGQGLGQAGEATRLDASTGLAHSDNGYVAQLYQVGPVGFLLLMTAIVALCRPLFREVWRDRGRNALGVFLATALSLLLVMLGAGDILYGATGAVFWYLIGCGHRWAGVRMRESVGDAPPAAG